MILMLLFLPLQGLRSYSSRGSASQLFEWFWSLTVETKALVNADDFRQLLLLLPKISASGVLVQALAERWWDTTHTFHIAKWEITMTSMTTTN